ncbi:HK97 gp10 family phage protein [Spartinivicinus ruber]|uniref:HK97 gp10 family phage protein n=1 Tax=Spartinivicinus ruber TaxID=2683272 RepID=UPI0015B618BF|nr:HK97 gp10 family phage protein [Spartinivicinus ruber]
MSFSSDLGRFSVESLQAVERIIRAIKLELFSGVILDTPVDTGRARGNWQTSTGYPKTSTVERFGANASLNEMRNNLGGLDGTTYLTNNLPYIERLEFGYSRQAPSGMLRKNFARINQIVQRAANQHSI